MEGDIMRTLCIILLLLFPLSANAFDGWTKEDKELQLTLFIVSLMDYKTTKDIVEKRFYYSDDGILKERHENNPFLSNHPSKGEINRMFLLSLAGHTLITHILPEEYREVWQRFWVNTEIYAVNKNIRVDLIKINF
jgi:hypothetical protein